MNNLIREAGEKTYRDRFNELGLSEGFKFLRREWSREHDKRYWVQCRKCGAILLKNEDVFKGKAKSIRCPNCKNGTKLYSDEITSMLAYYAEGHSVDDTAKRFNITPFQVNYYAKRRGVTNGKVWGDVANQNRANEAERRYAEWFDSQGIDYLGGYEGKSSKFNLRCRKCGTTFSRGYYSVRDKTAACPACKAKANAIKRQEREEARRADAERRRQEREAFKAYQKIVKASEPSAYQKEREKRLDDKCTCKVCGKTFTIREYMNSTGTKYARRSSYCSKECMKVVKRNKEKERKKKDGVNHIQRAKKLGLPYEKGITLKTLIKRDGLQCAICGMMCNPNDRSDKGVGGTYPTIDHIVPMSKGGGHLWSNVQVAHFICNSAKSDRIRKENGKYEKSRRVMRRGKDLARRSC